jgi:predicted SAM-dependent methyltransferase
VLGSLLKGVLGAPPADAPIRLHIGGTHPHPDWKILNVQAGPGVDYVGDCTDLSRFADASVSEVYASHVLEHLSYVDALPRALSEIRRVLVPGGRVRISVPDIEVLSAWMADRTLSRQEHFFVMRMMFGGQTDALDFHKVGLSWELLDDLLEQTGFVAIERVDRFGFVEDSSEILFRDRLVSLNVIAQKQKD